MGLNRNVIDIIVVLLFIVGYFIYMQIRRAQNAKKVINHLLCDMTTDIGTSYTTLLPIDGNVVHDDRNKDKSFSYIVNEAACYECDYPEGKNKLEQVKAKKAYYHENNPEPRIKRTDATIASAKVLNAIRNEKATEVAMQTSRDLKADQEFIKKNMLSPMFVYILLFVIIIGVGAAIAIMYQQGQVQAADIQAIKQAIGLK